MIARIWHGRTPREKADSYVEYLEKTGVRDQTAIEGNRGELLGKLLFFRRGADRAIEREDRAREGALRLPRLPSEHEALAGLVNDLGGYDDRGAAGGGRQAIRESTRDD